MSLPVSDGTSSALFRNAATGASFRCGTVGAFRQHEPHHHQDASPSSSFDEAEDDPRIPDEPSESEEKGARAVQESGDEDKSESADGQEEKAGEGGDGGKEENADEGGDGGEGEKANEESEGGAEEKDQAPGSGPVVAEQLASRECASGGEDKGEGVQICEPKEAAPSGSAKNTFLPVRSSKRARRKRVNFLHCRACDQYHDKDEACKSAGKRKKK